MLSGRGGVGSRPGRVILKTSKIVHTSALFGVEQIRVRVGTAFTYQVEEVSGSRPGRVILKTLKIVPTAALLGAEYIRVRGGAVITFSR